MSERPHIRGLENVHNTSPEVVNRILAETLLEDAYDEISHVFETMIAEAAINLSPEFRADLLTRIRGIDRQKHIDEIIAEASRDSESNLEMAAKRLIAQDMALIMNDMENEASERDSNNIKTFFIEMNAAIVIELLKHPDSIN